MSESRARHTNDEEGAVLIMALVFLTVAGLLVAALLGFADTGFRTTLAVRDQRNVVYAADGAVDAAINSYRYNSGACAAGPAVNGVAVTVSCTASTTPSSTPSNAPPLAVIARATQASGEDGVSIVSSAVTRVRGGAFSNNTASIAAGAQLQVEGTFKARWGCDRPALVSTTVGSPECNIANAAYPGGDDPGYAPLVATAPPPASVPSCPPTGAVELQPGTYNNAAALNALFTTCSGRVFHFKPNADGTAGAYYFDFEDAGSHEWSVSGPSTVVIGGQLAPGVTHAGASPALVGGLCDDSRPGVQFVFGNDSRLNVHSGAVELCPDHDAANVKQEIALFGMTAAHQTAAPPAQAATVHPPLSPAAAAGTAFSPAPAGAAIDGATADATVSSSEATADTIVLSGFDVSGIPTGSTLNKVEVVLRHGDRLVGPTGASLADLDLSGAVASPTGGSAVLNDKSANCAPRCLTKAEALHDDAVDVTSTFGTLAKLAGLTVSYSASAKQYRGGTTTFTDSFDGAQLKVTYTPPPSTAPRYRAMAGCATQVPYGAAGTCAVVRTGGSQAALAVHGTVYAPGAALDVHLVDVSYQVFKRGVVVRHLRSNVTASSACASAAATVPANCYAFQLPSPATTAGDVLFTARYDGRTRLRALVQFGSPATAPIVKSWSVVNEP